MDAREAVIADRPLRVGPSSAAASDSARARLEECAIRLRGRLPSSSNAAFLVDALFEDCADQAVYKPARGERPLWDFPSGLAHREYGASLLDRALGWNVVPPTVLRSDLPLGTGSLQVFVPFHLDHNYFTMSGHRHLRPRLERICVLDFVMNNADRKAGHCLLGVDGDVWAIDNGLSFHRDSKLRTVIWDFAGEDLPVEVRGDLEGLLDAGLPEQLVELLDPPESEATLERVRTLLRSNRFPSNVRGFHDWPWPLV